MTDWVSIYQRLPEWANEEVEWRRDFHDQTPFVAAWSSFYPEFNVHGLRWRPLSARLRELGLS